MTSNRFTYKELSQKIEELERESEKFRKIDEQYSAILNHSADFIFVIDKAFRVTSVNPQGSRFLNKKPEEIIGKSIRQLFPKEISKKFSSSLEKVLSTGDPATYKSSLTVGGRERWLTTQLIPVKDEAGEVSAVIGVSRDITERKQAEKALKESEELLRNFVEFTTLGIWCFRPAKPVDINLPEDQMIDEFFQSICIECNDTYASMMGVSKEEIIGLKLSDAMPNTDENRGYLRAFIQNGFKLSGGISRELTQDGKEKYFSNSMVGVIKNGRLMNAWGTQIDITERKQAEEALVAEKSFIETALNTHPDTFFVFDISTGKAVRWNQAFREISGYTDEEIDSLKAPDSYYGAEDLEKVPAVVQEMMKKGMGSIEMSLITKDGRSIPTDYTSGLIRDGEGNPEYIIAIGRDVSERKKAEEEVARSEAFLRDVIENAAGVPFRLIFGPTIGTGRYEFIGAGIDNILGIPPDEFTEQYFNELTEEVIPLIPELTADSEANRKAMIEGHILQYKADVRVRTKHNKLKWLSDTSLPLKDNKTGKVIGSFGILQDITERKRAEEELWKLASVVKYSSELINLATPDGKMIFLNEAGSKMLGIDIEDVENVNVMQVIPDHLKVLVQRELLPELRKSRVWKGELQYLNLQTGKPIDVYSVTFTITDPVTGEPLYFANVSHDISERKQAEEALKKSEEQLRQIQKLEGIGQLAGGIAHDINNILTAMIGHTELALRGIKKDKNIRNNLEQVMSSGRTAGELVAKILAFSRRQIIYPEIINVNGTILNLAETLHRVISEDIKIEMNLQDNISPVKADPTQIEQILINLAVNARDAINLNKKRKTEKSITIETAETFLDKKYVSRHIGSTIGPHILISVTDNGIGMDKEIINRIFEPFFTTKDLGKGTGLGLSTVYGIVKQNNGSIYVHSKPGEGTTIKIYWPALKGKTQLERTVKGGKVKGGSETILFVEDDDEIRKASEQLLVLHGYKVFSTLNGRLALDLVKTKNVKIDMLVTDVVMPVMGGIELAEKLKKIFPGLKILYCSGYSNNHTISQNGVVDKDVNFISKPYSIDKLAKKMREILDKK